MNEIKRCFGNNSQIYSDYHDNEWGIPSYDDQHLFEMLILEGAQAGLSWETILNKRDNYRKQFCAFDPVAVAQFTDHQLNECLQNPGIIRNRLKVYATRSNAQAYLAIQAEFGSFSNYLWRFVDGEPIINHWQQWSEVPVSTSISEKLSKDLKQRNMKFVGPSIMYAYMQATGMVNDHLLDCHCRSC